MILPGLECDEIDTAISHGLREDRLVLVHESAAHVAKNAVWRKKYPNIKFYCCKASNAPSRLWKDGIKLVAANLDFCGNFSGEMIDEFSEFCEKAPLCDESWVALTMMKGRESTAMVKLVDAVAKTNKQSLGFKEKRLEVMFSLFGIQKKFVRPYQGPDFAMAIDVEKFGEFCYTHNKAPMACGITKITNHENIANKKLIETEYYFNEEIKKIEDAIDYVLMLDFFIDKKYRNRRFDIDGDAKSYNMSIKEFFRNNINFYINKSEKIQFINNAIIDLIKQYNFKFSNVDQDLIGRFYFRYIKKSKLNKFQDFLSCHLNAYGFHSEDCNFSIICERGRDGQKVDLPEIIRELKIKVNHEIVKYYG